MSGALFAAGILSAYIGAKATGRGTMVSNSLLGSAVWFNASDVMSSQFGKTLPMDKDRPINPMGYPYECKDGEWLFLGAGNYKADFPRVCRAVGLACVAEDPKFCEIGNMHDNIDEFMPLIRHAFKQRNRDEWLDIFDSLDMVCGKIGHISELHTDPQAIANKYIVPVKFPSGHTVDMVGSPVVFDDYDSYPYMPAGRIGRDTDEILEELGYTKETIETIKLSGAIK